jgi:hypothetical protein
VRFSHQAQGFLAAAGLGLHFPKAALLIFLALGRRCACSAVQEVVGLGLSASAALRRHRAVLLSQVLGVSSRILGSIADELLSQESLRL